MWRQTDCQCHWINWQSDISIRNWIFLSITTTVVLLSTLSHELITLHKVFEIIFDDPLNLLTIFNPKKIKVISSEKSWNIEENESNCCLISIHICFILFHFFCQSFVVDNFNHSVVYLILFYCIFVVFHSMKRVVIRFT